MERERTGQCSESDQNNDSPDVDRDSHNTRDDSRDIDAPSRSTTGLHGIPCLIGASLR